MKRITLFVLFVLVFLAVVPAFAQDTEPAPVPPALAVPTVEELLHAVEVTLTAVLAGVIASPVTSACVGLVKWAGDRFNVALIKNATGEQINTVMVFLIVGLVWTARALGFVNELDSAFKVVLALTPILGGVAAGARASSGFYRNVSAGRVALVGYRRPQGIPEGKINREAFMRA